MLLEILIGIIIIALIGLMVLYVTKPKQETNDSLKPYPDEKKRKFAYPDYQSEFKGIFIEKKVDLLNQRVQRIEDILRNKGLLRIE